MVVGQNFKDEGDEVTTLILVEFDLKKQNSHHKKTRLFRVAFFVFENLDFLGQNQVIKMKNGISQNSIQKCTQSMSKNFAEMYVIN
jgi:hypothetical protein